MLHEAIQFAEEHMLITRKDVEVIFHAQTSILYNDREPCVQNVSGSINVTMGAYDGAEVCELIGIFMLYSKEKNTIQTILGYIEMTE